MATPSEEEDLKLAIALSMNGSPGFATDRPSANREVVDLTSDTSDEDDDIRKAIAMSLQQSATGSGAETTVYEKGSASSTSANKDKIVAPSPSSFDTVLPSASYASSSILGLNRKKMEEERLARLGKRKRGPSPDRLSKQIAKGPPPAESSNSIGKQPQIARGSHSDYQTGAIKRTFASKYPRTDDITFDEVLQADRVNIAVISSFMWDSDWLSRKLNPLKVKQIWIMNAKERDVQERFRQDLKDSGVPNLKMHFPPMDGMVHSMHSKFMLLFGEKKLRFVVCTANMTPFDWGEVKNDWQPGVMENSVFLIDLPRNADGNVGDKASLTTFGKELIHFLEKQQVDQKVIEGVSKFDFEQTGHLGFVHSI